MNHDPQESRVIASIEDTQKAIKILALKNHGFFHLKYSVVDGIIYQTYVQTTHNSTPEMKECALSHKFFIGKTLSNYYIIFHVPISYTLPYIKNDEDGIISSKQELLLINSLKDRLNKPIHSILYLKASNFEDALAELSQLKAFNFILTDNYNMSTISLGDGKYIYQIRFIMKLSDYNIDPSSIKPMEKDTNEFFKNQFINPEVPEGVKKFIIDKALINTNTGIVGHLVE